MELPIDHFRLLGVSPSADAEGILRTLELRLDRPPQDGFTQESLLHRADLLRLSADLLTDKKLREEYESALLGGAVALDLASKREVAGLILLLEADSPYDAFKLACNALKPPQTPALGSSREADLTLIAALSCRSAALQEQEDRHYESAAKLLAEGLQLLQRMGKLSEYRETLENELNNLMPYRILDLVSRDLADQISHQEGLRLLDEYVTRRGGLEGNKLSSELGVLNQTEFEIFFQQIRKFLTVQEQSDLYFSWQRTGSLDAAFLRVLSLVAQGYSRRKPGKIKEARKLLKNKNFNGIDSMPLLGCIDILLADLELAENSFNNSQDDDLRDWLDNYQGEHLAALCEYCTNWLRHDVLPGFRDVDADTVDLEAWFGDRDVKDYIEKIDRKGPREIAKAGFSFLTSLSLEADEGEEENKDQKDQDSYGNILSESDKADYELDDYKKRENETLSLKSSDVREVYLENLYRTIRDRFLKQKSIRIGSLLFFTFLLLASLLNFLSYRIKLANNFEKNNSIENQEKTFNNDSSIDIESNNNKKDITSEMKSLQGAAPTDTKIEDNYISERKEIIKSLTDPNPSESQILQILETWLQEKSIVLQGGNSDLLKSIVRESLYQRVIQERKEDSLIGQTQTIEATIKSLDIVSQTNKRIEVKVRLSYKDKRLNSLNEMISETLIPNLDVTYIFGRERLEWQLVDYISGS